MKLAPEIGLTWPEQQILLRKEEEFKPFEVCGFVLKDGRVLTAPNISPDPQCSFAIDPKTHLYVLEHYNGFIRGVWHTHPSGHGYPSNGDCLGIANGGIDKGWKYWIVTRIGIYCWDWEDDPSFSLI